MTADADAAIPFGLGGFVIGIVMLVYFKKRKH
jgi:LPXTG-motif cell wall-anchored protein